MRLATIPSTLACTALAVAYTLLPASPHPLLPGAPLTIAGAGFLILASAAFVLRNEPIERRTVALLLVLGTVKALASTSLPRRGFEGTYYPRADFSGDAYPRIDPVLDFGIQTFPRNFLNERALAERSNTRWENPFSVVWRGTIVLREPTIVTVDAAASEPVTVAIDGAAPTTQPLTGAHLVEIRFARRQPEVLSLRAAVNGQAAAGGDTHAIAVWAGTVGTAKVRAAEWYTPLAFVLDLIFVAWLIWSIALDFRRVLAGPWPARWIPPFSIAAAGVLAFWFILGAVRIHAVFHQMEWMGFGDDWIRDENTARRVASGHLLGTTDAVFGATFLYAYYLGALHAIFGEFIQPLFFAQHVLLGLACVLSGLFARKLWGEWIGFAVLAVTSVLGCVDVYRWYLTRLLSENGMLLLAPIIFLAVQAYLERPGVGRAFLAGAMLGAGVLCRFNMLPFGLLATAYLALRPARGERAENTQNRIAVAAGFLVILGVFPLREFLVTGVPRPVPMESTIINYVTYPGSFFQRAQRTWTAPFTEVILPNIAFILGYPKLQVAYHSIRPHWLLLWIAYGAWIWRHRRTPTPPMVWVLHLYVLGNLAALLPYGFIAIYGFRYLLPLVFGVGLFLPGGLVALSEMAGLARAPVRTPGR